ncbi:MAG: PD-(D/E)XK nuclease family protein [Planctomycetes bacterium]|nr:PD-(D/E)XK nuclease family protein [Planctomycetota bacterium]
MAEEELSSEEALRALERFVVENDDLLALEERIGRFNIFDALGVARAEIRHSNFLAWLLDPAESHGQGALFLKAILMDLLAQTPPELRPFSPVQLDGAELRGVDIRREWKKLDILITCEEPKFVIAIENKIDSGEHGKQLSRYEEAVNQGFGDRPKQFVYLTIDGDEPSEEKWVPYTYGDIHRVLTRVRNTHSQAIGDDVLVFQDHYLRLIGSRFMDDPKIDELCQRIYGNHRQAIELIVERIKSPIAELVTEMAELIRKDERWRLINYTSKNVIFMPAQWLDLLPPIAARSKFGEHAWVVLRFDFSNKGCHFGVSVWPTTNRELRRAVIKELISDPDKFGCRVHGKLTDQWTRLHKSVVARWNEGDEPDFEKVIAKVQKRLDEAERRLAGVPEALQPIFEQQATPAGSP